MTTENDMSELKPCPFSAESLQMLDGHSAKMLKAVHDLMRVLAVTR